MANYLLIAGTSTIGTITAKKLISQGHKVIITGRKKEKTQAIASNLNIPYLFLDATNFDDVDKVFIESKEKFGEINGVVNFAGSLLLKPAHLTSQSDYDSIILANLTTSFAVVKAAANHMNSNGGSVVLISSAVALVGIHNHEAIAAAKAGIVGLALSAAATYAGNNLRFNVIAPGLTETHLTESITTNPTSRKFSENMHALGRLGQAEDIASAVIFFLLPENNWITGQILAVDGGLSSIRPKIKI